VEWFSWESIFFWVLEAKLPCSFHNPLEECCHPREQSVQQKPSSTNPTRPMLCPGLLETLEGDIFISHFKMGFCFRLDTGSWLIFSILRITWSSHAWGHPAISSYCQNLNRPLSQSSLVNFLKHFECVCYCCLL
jgi:hypothetical protein